MLALLALPVLVFAVRLMSGCASLMLVALFLFVLVVPAVLWAVVVAVLAFGRGARARAYGRRTPRRHHVAAWLAGGGLSWALLTATESDVASGDELSPVSQWLGREVTDPFVAALDQSSWIALAVAFLALVLLTVFVGLDRHVARGPSVPLPAA